MQRIRYGLTGLAFVFLMVLLGTVIVRSGDAGTGNVTANEVEESGDPLAQLGVAPGQGADPNLTDNNVATPAR